MVKNLKGDEGVAEGRELPRIEALAYSLWVERGRPIGSPEVDWFEAERSLSSAGESADALGA